MTIVIYHVYSLVLTEKPNNEQSFAVGNFSSYNTSESSPGRKVQPEWGRQYSDSEKVKICYVIQFLFNISQIFRKTEKTDQSILLFTVSAVVGFVTLDVIEKEFLMKFITNSTWKKTFNEWLNKFYCLLFSLLFIIYHTYIIWD